jgi:hypothetical protein
MATRRLQPACAGWLLLLAVVAPAALAGCGGNQRARSNTPTERVAGSRQEDETARVLREGSLPETFAFGGRTWRAHQVHWVDQTPGASGTTTSGTDGTAGTTGTMPERTDNTATGTPLDTGMPGAIGNFVPVADLQFEGHAIYRQTGADEAVTDNIFLKAENVSPSAAAGDTAATGTGTGTTGGAGTASTNAGENNAASTNPASRMAFVEYDADVNMMQNLKLSQVLPVAELPQMMKASGKTWTAKELQVYDADVFDDLKPTAQMMNGFEAFQGDDKNAMYVMSKTAVSMPAATAETGTGAANTPGSETGTEPMMLGPVFVRYEAAAGAK